VRHARIVKRQRYGTRSLFSSTVQSVGDIFAVLAERGAERLAL
jgi:hypothetical protein